MDYGDVIYDIPIKDRNSPFPVNLQNNQLMMKVKSIQYEAAIIVTGAWHGTSRDKLYAELGWESLYHRCTYRRLSMLFEVTNKQFPNYLFKLVEKQQFKPQSRFYGKQLLINIPCRTDKHRLSFLQATIKDWNFLEKDVKDSTSLPFSKIIFCIK